MIVTTCQHELYDIVESLGDVDKLLFTSVLYSHVSDLGAIRWHRFHVKY